MCGFVCMLMCARGYVLVFGFVICLFVSVCKFELMSVLCCVYGCLCLFVSVRFCV